MKKFAAILAAIMILAMLCGTIVPVAATEETPGEDVVEEFDSSMYDAAAEGALLYTLNFAGDDIWQPGNLTRTAVVTPDADDPTKCVFYAEEDEGQTFWGAPIKGLPIGGPAGDGSDDYYAYTVEFKTIREHQNEKNGMDAAFGLYIDDTDFGTYGYSDNFSIMSGGVRLIGKYSFISEGFTPQGINYSAEGADATQPSIQEYALEVNAYDDTLKLYMKDSTNEWCLIQATEIGDIMSFTGTYLCPCFYTYYQNQPITVDYVKIYKGMTLSGDELPVNPDAGNDTPADTTTVPADTTTVPADTTTVPADTTTAPQGNTTTAPQGNTTTEAPKSNGCGGFAVLPVSIVAILGLAVTVVTKKAL